MRSYDAIVIGGGPAGLGAAIAFAAAGRSVLVVERGAATPDGPGETFHPGIEPVFDQLGVGAAMRRCASARHDAVIVDRAGRRETSSYGKGWLGFQIRRGLLNHALEARLDRLGGERSLGNRALALDHGRDRHVVATDDGPFAGRWLLDASGSAGWLDRRMATSMRAASEPIWLRYGYQAATASDGRLPRLRMGDRRWSWRAPLGDGETAWVEGASDRPFGAREMGGKGADGTWRLSPQPAGPGFFRIGDAACRLDPRNGHGVLRAMMSAIMATHLAALVDHGAIDRSRAAGIYNGWIAHWFRADVDHLRALILTIGTDGHGQGPPGSSGGAGVIQNSTRFAMPSTSRHL